MPMAEARVKLEYKNKQYCIIKEQHCLTLNYGKAMLFFLYCYPLIKNSSGVITGTLASTKSFLFLVKTTSTFAFIAE